MPNPLEAALAFLDSDIANLPIDDGDDFGVKIPVTVATNKVFVQLAWDGTPSDADNREDAAVRFTVWGAKNQPGVAQNAAAGLRARLLDHSSATVWRVDRGAGRLPGTDDRTGLPFCTFTVSFVMHALTP